MTALGDHDITQHPGTAVPVPPAAAFDWAAQAQGAGTRTLRWTVSGGDWIVVMNPDGSPGITVRADAGVTLPVLPAPAGELFAAGITVGLIGAALETGFAVRLRQSHGITSLPTAAARTHRVTDVTKLPDSTCLPGGLAAGSASPVSSASSTSSFLGPHHYAIHRMDVRSFPADRRIVIAVLHAGTARAIVAGDRPDERLIDQSAGREAGLELADTTLVIFGSPYARTAMALGNGVVSPRALDPAFKNSAGRADASLQGDEEDGCGKEEAVQDRGRRNVYRWGLRQGDSRRAGIGRCRCRRYPAWAWPRVPLVLTATW